MRYIFILFICILSIGCKKSPDTIRDLDNADGMIENRDFVSRIDFVYLQDADGYLLSSVCGVRAFDDKWYILDNDERNAVLAFDETGAPAAKYDKVGRGPGEYIDIMGFDADPDSGDICILCGPPKIILLDKNLNFKKEIMLDKFYNRVAYCDGGFLLFSGQDCTVDYVSAEDGSSERIFEAEADYRYTDNHNPVFIRDNGRIFFQTESEDALYEIVGRKFVEVAEYDYSGRTEAQKKHAEENVTGEDALIYIRPQILCVANEGNNMSFVYRKSIYRFNMEDNGEYRNLDLALTGLNSSFVKIGRKLVGWIYSYDYDPATFNGSGIYDGIEVDHIPWSDESKESGNPVLVAYTLKPSFGK